MLSGAAAVVESHAVCPSFLSWNRETFFTERSRCPTSRHSRPCGFALRIFGHDYDLARRGFHVQIPYPRYAARLIFLAELSAVVVVLVGCAWFFAWVLRRVCWFWCRGAPARLPHACARVEWASARLCMAALLRVRTFAFQVRGCGCFGLRSKVFARIPAGEFSRSTYVFSCDFDPPPLAINSRIVCTNFSVILMFHVLVVVVEL